MKNLFLLSIVLFSGCVAFFSCTNSGISNKVAGTVAFDTVAAKKAVDSVNQVFAESIAKGDSVAAANCYTADAEFMGSNAPAVTGKKNMLSLFAGFIKSGVTKIVITTTALWGSADMIVEEGTYKLSIANGQQVDNGKYIALWKKEDGKWKIFRDCSNSDLPLPESK